MNVEMEHYRSLRIKISEAGQNVNFGFARKPGAALPG